VSSAIIAAGAGSVAGGWLADRAGRRAALLLADGLFAAGALAMAAARDQYWLIAGRALVGLGVGLASVTVPVYIAECAPPGRRASLVTANVLAITTGQFVAYLADWGFSYAPGTWRWMLGVGAVPALLQAGGLLLLPESPRWLAGRGRAAEASCAMQKLQPGGAAAAAAAAAAADPAGGSGDAGGGTAAAAAGSPASRAARPSSSSNSSPSLAWRLLRSRAVARELHVGVGLQILQQVAGINTVM
jgi:SP family myo-inositol transporter-like MFS transporter 13